MFVNQILDIKNLIQITSSGIKVATFSQIKASLIARYKQIYGSDIEVDDTNADGIFLNDLALIINNILQSCQTAFGNLDINSASGIYLDRLCALSNIIRKPATKSIAKLTLENLDTTTPIMIENGLQFVDRAGLLWMYNGNDIEIPIGDTLDINVECDTYGEITAPAENWIYQAIEVLPISVTQSEDAIVGENEETDQSLRARQAASNGNQGVTILDGMVNDLLALSGVRDVYIYNNNDGSSVSFGDGTEINAHSIYVIIRYENAEESKIGQIIFEDLTPGIVITECDSNVTGGTGKSYLYRQNVPSIGGVSFNNNVYWKKAEGLNPQIVITVTTTPNYTSDEVDEIKQYLFNYLNNLPIMNDLHSSDIISETIMADPTFKGRSTFIVNNVTINGNTSFTNTGSFYNYTNLVSSGTSGTITFTLT